MKVIGLTGGIASGKSSVSAMLRELGARVIDADSIARQVVEPGKPAWQEIVRWLGQEILLPGGTIDRKKLGELVFADPATRHRLEEITHPRIRDEAMRQVAAKAATGVELVVLDVPLLFEVGWDKFADEVWVVYVDAATQTARLMQRDGITREQAESRIDAQMSLAEKARKADVIIDNSKEPESTKRQVAEAWRRILAG